jgi:hypothetical protein
MAESERWNKIAGLLQELHDLLPDDHSEFKKRIKPQIGYSLTEASYQAWAEQNLSVAEEMEEEEASNAD